MVYSSHCVLPDGGTLLAVVETHRERRWLRTVEHSETVAYVHKFGQWWGKDDVRVTDNAKILRLCELVMQAGVRESVDRAVAL